MGLTHFHYLLKILSSKVAEKDNIVHSILEDEYRRSQEVVKTLHAKAGNYPKGALNVRRK
jgi:hypothetical protein